MTKHNERKQKLRVYVFDESDNPHDKTVFDYTITQLQVLGSGTGGTLTGISRKFREISPNTLIIGADPYGSIHAEPPELNITDVKFVEIEGIGYETIPTVCDRRNVDKWYKLFDYESLNMARRMIKEEGLLVGTSSGVFMAAALKAIKDFKLGKGKKVVVLLPDGAKNYLTKFINDQWMEQRGFLPCPNINNHWWWDVSATEIKSKPFEIIPVTTSLEDVLAIMDKLNVDYLPVEDDGAIAGIAIRRNVTNKLISSSSPKEEVKQHIERLFSKLPKTSHVGLVSRVLEKENYVVLLDSEGRWAEQAIGI